MADAEEERILRSMSRKGAAGLSPRPHASVARAVVPAQPPPSSSSPTSPELELLHKQRKNAQGVFATGRRELEALAAELEKLALKKAELEHKQAQRQEALDQLTREIEAIEASRCDSFLSKAFSLTALARTLRLLQLLPPSPPGRTMLSASERRRKNVENATRMIAANTRRRVVPRNESRFQLEPLVESPCHSNTRSAQLALALSLNS